MSFLKYDMLNNLNNFHVDCIQAFFALYLFIFYLIILTYLTFKTCFMNKNVFTSIFWFNKSKSFGVVEKFYG